MPAFEFGSHCYAPAPNRWGIKRCFCLTSACLSVAYIEPKSRTERGLGRPKLAQKKPTSHMTRTPLSRLRSPGRFAHRRVGTSGGCSDGCQNVLAVGNCCYVAICSATRGVSAPTGGRGERRVHIMADAHLQLVYINSSRGANRLWGESSVGQDTHGAKRPWGKTSMGRNILQWGEVSMGRIVRGAKSPDTGRRLCGGYRPLINPTPSLWN